jgi:DNA-binding GntR family transcriptional regulator
VNDLGGALSPIGGDRTVEQMLVRALRAAILAGRLAPGARLPYRELAAEFGVSVTPVRVALRELSQEGLVVTRPHEGARVAPLSRVELEEIYAARTGFEGWLVHEGAPQLRDRDVREMDRCLAKIELAAEAGDLRDYLDASWAHRSIAYAAAARPEMLAKTSTLYQRAARYNWLTLSEEGRLGESLIVARELHVACAARDGERARNLVRASLDHTIQHLATRFADLERGE